MHQRDHARFWGRLGVRGALIMGIAGSACCLSVPALAGPAGPARAGTGNAGRLSTGPVSPVPADGTPTLVDTGTTEQIRQFVQCGTTMYAVGTFTEIKQGSTTYLRNNVFSFSASAPYPVTSWAPDVNGTVDTITFSGGNCEIGRAHV